MIKDSYSQILHKYDEVDNKQLLWELIKMEIRSETMRYSKKKNNQLKTRESTIQRKTEELDSKICNDVCLDQCLLSEYESLKKELNEIYEIKGRGAIFRSKVEWIEKGEKPTRYFFNLEKKNFEKKIITQLKIGDDEIMSDFKQINKEIESFFTDFYRSNFYAQNQTDAQEKFKEFVENLKTTKLSEQEKEELECELSLDELKNALKGFQNNKTPGEDGFTN